MTKTAAKIKPAGKTKTFPFDMAEYLGSDEAVIAYLDEALATGDAAYVVHALGVVARARGMAAIAKDAGLSRESLYRTLSADGNPKLDTVLKVLAALKVRLAAAPAE